MKKNMKKDKVMRYLSVLLLFVLSCSSDNDIGQVTAKSGLNMRVKPNPKAKVILTIPYGARAKILDHNGPYYQTDDIKAKWKKVVYRNKVGWVYSRYFLNEKIIEEMIVVKVKEKATVPSIKIDISKAVKVRKELYNANNGDIVVYDQPSQRAIIKDYLKSSANVFASKYLRMKNEHGQMKGWYFYEDVGWILEKNLKEIPTAKIRAKLRKFISTGQFYNTSKKNYSHVTKLENITYFDIQKDIVSLMKGSRENISIAMAAGVRTIKEIKKGVILIICYGHMNYPKFIYSQLYTQQFHSHAMPYKNSKERLFSIELEIIDKNTIKYKGKIYRKLK